MMKNLTGIVNRLHSQSIWLGINKIELQNTLDILINCVMFPICNKMDAVDKSLMAVYTVLLKNISALVDSQKALTIIDAFIETLPNLQTKLYSEAEVYYNNDPAANSVEEVIVTYPGFFALAVYRISHQFLLLGVPILPRLFSEYAHSKVGIDINPGAHIGHSFYIDHGTGIVIGESTVIGNNVKIYQGVTLGALFVTKELSNKKRHPTIEDNVVIYAGATILGGKTIIGHDSIIGGNAWLTKSIPPYSQVIQNAEIRIRSTLNGGDPIIDFSI